MSGRSRRQPGFTLVELLVVITIIGMLVALLLPAIGAARARMFQSQCANNLRQIGQAMINAATSKGTLPGYIQPVPRDGSNGKSFVLAQGGLSDSVYTNTNDRLSSRVSWAAVLLPRLDRNDIWERITDSGIVGELVKPIDVYICPVDAEARSSPENAALTYIANTGAWDWNGSTYLIGSNVGDTSYNGLFHNLTDGKTTSKLEVNDGGATTIMLSENINKQASYSWLGVAGNQLGEQQLGMVWVVPQPSPPTQSPSPVPGNNVYDQEGIGKETINVFDPSIPRFARPASSHPTGAFNVVFVDGHTRSIQPEIDYVVYQQLLTPNGRKCVDPRDHNAGVNPPTNTNSIFKFRAAPPLSESDLGD